jgi:hypothetical protein
MEKTSYGFWDFGILVLDRLYVNFVFTLLGVMDAERMWLNPITCRIVK